MRIGTKTWLKESITLAPYAIYGEDSEPTWGTGVATACMITSKVQMIRDAAGLEKVSVAQILVDGATTITLKDKITMPDGTIPLILSIDTVYDAAGAAFAKRIYT